MRVENTMVKNILSNPIIRTDFKEELIIPENLMSIKIIFFCFLLCLGLPLSAKKKVSEYPKSDIKVSYNYHNVFLKGSDNVNERDIPFLLLSNSEESKFYCKDTENKDSLQSTPEGKKLSRQMLTEAINQYMNTKNESLMSSVVYKTQLYVFKSFADNQFKVYDNTGLERAFYVEPIDVIDWEISDSTKNILGYECFLAEADYHGRHWTAWFTPEIPIQNGPWKLQGLPGLILEASEPTGQHTFLATGIEKSTQEMLPVYNPKQYDKSNRIDMLKTMRNFMDNQNSIVKASIDLDLGPDAPKTAEYKKFDFLETDYH